tara:strand:+ start:3956 stop:5143 length:1188 start_codon:yes stop_codon:yes gene_type:complete
MTQPNLPTKTSNDPQAVDQLTAAAHDFFETSNSVLATIQTKLQKQEKQLAMLDRNQISRPILAHHDMPDAPHKKAFNTYLRSGEDGDLRGLDIETKGLSSAVNSDGGYLVDPQTANAINSSLSGAASVRAIASVVTVEASSYDVLIDHTDVGAGWSDENSAPNESDSPQIDRITIPLHELNALPKASQRLLDDSAFDIEGWLATRISDKFTRAEGAAFVSGNGIDKPKGFLTYDTVSVGAEEWGKLGHVITGASGDFAEANPADALVDLVYALGAHYRANASFVMNSKTAGRVRKLKDNDGRFLWSDGLASAEPARLLGYQVLVSEDMPDIADWAPAIAFGDFKAGYTIAERPDLRVLRDPFSAKPHVLFYATKRVGGDVSDFAAIKLLKFAAQI